MAEEYFTFKEDGNLYREDGTIVDLGEEVTSDDTVVVDNKKLSEQKEGDDDTATEEIDDARNLSFGKFRLNR